jgi:hypothetical protein
LQGFSLPPPIVSLKKESLKPKICTPLARKGKKTRAKSKRSSLHNNETKTKTQKKEKDSKMRLYTCKKTRENQKHEVKSKELG